MLHSAAALTVGTGAVKSLRKLLTAYGLFLGWDVVVNIFCARKFEFNFLES